MVKIINESHIGYMSVSVGKQVVLVLHTQFMGKLRNHIFCRMGGVREKGGWYLDSVQVSQPNISYSINDHHIQDAQML